MKKKKRIIHKSILCGMVLLMSLLFAGCSQEEMYEHAKNYEENSRKKIEEITNNATKNFDEGLESTEQEMEEQMASGTKYLSDASKKYGIWVILGSLLFWLILEALLYNSTAIKVKRTVRFVFLLGIPLGTVVAIYGSAALASWFM